MLDEQLKRKHRKVGNVSGREWTVAEDNLLRDQWNKRSATLLVTLFENRTRNAIIGRAWRIGLKTIRGLTPRQNVSRETIPPKAKPMRLATPIKKKAPPPKLPVSPPIAPLDHWQPLAGIVPVPLLELHEEHCRWPVTGGSCGCQKEEGSSYCKTHRAMGITGTSRALA